MDDTEGEIMTQTREQQTEILEPPDWAIRAAILKAACSPCQSKRGVVIFADRVIATGCNFKPHPFLCDGSDACKATCRTDAIHAEQMALLVASRKAKGASLLHVKVADGQPVQSTGPSCVQCSKLIMGAEMATVWLLLADGWKSYTAEEFHRLSLDAGAAALREQEEIEKLKLRIRLKDAALAMSTAANAELRKELAEAEEIAIHLTQQAGQQFVTAALRTQPLTHEQDQYSCAGLIGQPIPECVETEPSLIYARCSRCRNAIDEAYDSGLCRFCRADDQTHPSRL